MRRHPFWSVLILVLLLPLHLLYNNCGADPQNPRKLGATETTNLPSQTNPFPTPGTPAASSCTSTGMKSISVNSVSAIASAIAGAKPGDAIEVQPGIYRLTSALNLQTSGTASSPICLRAAQLNTVTFESESSGYMAIKVSGAYWTIENLIIKGVCADDNLCEHAFQIKEAAHNTVIRNNVLQDFNAQIKGSATNTMWPNNVVIEGNHIFDSRARNTSNPTTKIDVVGGDYWVVRRNYIHDFQKGQGDGISYAAFLKGYSRYGLFESNVVACSLNFTGGTRLGLSFGGGTTGAQFCRDYNAATGKGCAFEHESGMMRNNIVLNCSDVGIFVRDTDKSVITNNLVIDTAGIDFLLDAGRPVPTSEASRNIVFGQIRDRNGAISIKKDNLVTQNRTTLASWFKSIDQHDYTYLNMSMKDISPAVSDVKSDMCGQARDASLDLGPFEFQSTNCFSAIMNLIKAAKK